MLGVKVEEEIVILSYKCEKLEEIYFISKTTLDLTVYPILDVQ